MALTPVRVTLIQIDWADDLCDLELQFILKELPENFVLWEHVKYKVDKLAEGKREKGKHAAGVYERQDAYLYGHPQGRKKRYRSPADFFHHVLFLVADTNDRMDCSCKICSPEGDEEVETAPKVEVVIKKPTTPMVVADVPRSKLSSFLHSLDFAIRFQYSKAGLVSFLGSVYDKLLVSYVKGRKKC